MSFYGNSRNLEYNLTISKMEDDTKKDGFLTYVFYQGNIEKGKINIPLNQLLDNVQLETIDNELCMVFYFKNSEDTNIKPVSIKVSDLNEFDSYKDSATISITVDKSNCLQAKIIPGQITKEYLADEVITAIDNSVVFNYENGRLKISYTYQNEIKEEIQKQYEQLVQDMQQEFDEAQKALVYQEIEKISKQYASYEEYEAQSEFVKEKLEYLLAQQKGENY